MSEKLEVKNPIEIKDNSIERVAFDLMEKIALYERDSSPNQNLEVTGKQKSRDYWLKLHNQCHRTVYSHNAHIKAILEDDFS